MGRKESPMAGEAEVVKEYKPRTREILYYAMYFSRWI